MPKKNVQKLGTIFHRKLREWYGASATHPSGPLAFDIQGRSKPIRFLGELRGPLRQEDAWKHA